MTRMEHIQSLTKEELAAFLCEINGDDCDKCVATEECRDYHKGFLDWLEEEE